MPMVMSLLGNINILCPHGTIGLALVAAPRSEGVITCSGELATPLESGLELSNGPYERALRTAVFTASDRRPRLPFLRRNWGYT